jgi:hypothetical protein
MIPSIRRDTATVPKTAKVMASAEESLNQSFANFKISDKAHVHAGNYHHGDNNHYYHQERPASPLTPFSNVPFAQDADYIDRIAISTEIHRRLVPGARLALVGLGGVG